MITGVIDSTSLATRYDELIPVLNKTIKEQKGINNYLQKEMRYI